ncbi:MAG: ferrous iron transport protein B [Vicinamibacteria bacterium]
MTLERGAAATAEIGSHAGVPHRPRGPVILVGSPNVGKSALFGALTGTYVAVSNYPGTTVEIARGSLALEGARAEIIDTPGVGSLIPSSEDERVSRDILLAEPAPRAVVVVGDAKNLERSLALALEVGETGLPLVFALNMMDEASTRGLGVDTVALSACLGVPVVPTVAVLHQGLRELVSALPAARPIEARPSYPPALEQAIAAASAGAGARAGTRTRAIDALCRRAAPASAGAPASPDPLALRLGEPVAAAVVAARFREAARIAARVRQANGRPRSGRRLSRGLERATTHPRIGLLLLAAVLFLTYEFVGVFGAGTLVGLFEDRLFGAWINPAAIALADRLLGPGVVRDLLVGPYGLITMALTYSLALVLPIVGTFFIAFGALEDSGYLPRLAVMANRGFRVLGLNGKAVLPMVLGLGCDTMATLTTRVLETPKERLIVILLLALGVPCSAQLAVSLALLQPLGPSALLIWGGVVAAVIVVAGRLAALVLPGHGSDFVLELPPLRVPRLGNIAVKTLARIEWYLREAVPLFVLGTLLLFFGDRLGALRFIERLAAPLVVGGLGLPAEAAQAFVIGFLRRDFGAAGLFRLVEEGRLSPAQVLVATVTMTLFIPCIANFFMIVKERGARTAFAIAAVIFPLAFGVGAALHATLHALELFR